jgi:hypothetical protein
VSLRFKTPIWSQSRQGTTSKRYTVQGLETPSTKCCIPPRLVIQRDFSNPALPASLKKNPAFFPFHDPALPSTFLPTSVLDTNDDLLDKYLTFKVSYIGLMMTQ